MSAPASMGATAGPAQRPTERRPQTRATHQGQRGPSPRTRCSECVGTARNRPRRPCVTRWRSPSRPRWTWTRPAAATGGPLTMSPRARPPECQRCAPAVYAEAGRHETPRHAPAASSAAHTRGRRLRSPRRRAGQGRGGRTAKIGPRPLPPKSLIDITQRDKQRCMRPRESGRRPPHPPVRSVSGGFCRTPVGSANDVAVTSPDVTRCHGVSQGDRERLR